MLSSTDEYANWFRLWISTKACSGAMPRFKEKSSVLYVPATCLVMQRKRTGYSSAVPKDNELQEYEWKLGKLLFYRTTQTDLNTRKCGYVQFISKTSTIFLTVLMLFKSFQGRSKDVASRVGDVDGNGWIEIDDIVEIVQLAVNPSLYQCSLIVPILFL